jgi:hypothetical protein
MSYVILKLCIAVLYFVLSHCVGLLRIVLTCFVICPGSPINCDQFYKRRRSAIQSKLLYLRSMTDRNLAHEISQRLTLHWGKRLYGITWAKVDPYFVMSVGWSIGGARLSVALEEMVRDPVCFSRGMPDLLFCQAMPAREFHWEETVEKHPQEDWSCAAAATATAAGDDDVQQVHASKCFVSEVKR